MSANQTAEYTRTKRLYWEPSYVPKEAIYPPAKSPLRTPTEGIPTNTRFV